MTRRKVKRTTSLILLIGFALASVIYLTANPPEPDPLGGDPLANKKYLRELQMYGGKANVASAEFVQWFEHLWRGETLAYTVSVITLLVAWGFWFVATHPDSLDADEPDNKQRKAR